MRKWRKLESIEQRSQEAAVLRGARAVKGYLPSLWLRTDPCLNKTRLLTKARERSPRK